ncbi:MAG: S-methyl-5'-thioadenosine phosphorylase [Methanomassiliicoccaceae archaeon]|jgi:5'-methylthioadenosine phosphorylase|nr:S-methyl-5'-thioadenosine phosphorylase [Methanomassiliicoccaceae archaeon]
MVRIGIIGGSGIYNPNTFETVKKIVPETKFGKPSDEITIGRIAGVEVAFIPRHGSRHQYPPHSVPYRANIQALKDLGVEIVISPCAVGSLKEEYRPGDLVIADQFIDLTKNRDYTFFDSRTVHISIADPFCPDIAKIFSDAASEMKIRHHRKGTYICIEGPRFSTKAESNMFRNFADIIGMTLVPECQLAREMGMCYCSLATVTDYDVWKDEPVDIKMVLKTMSECLSKITKLLETGLPRIPAKRKCNCADAPKDAGA